MVDRRSRHPLPAPLPRRGALCALRRLQGSDLRAFQHYRHDPAVGRYQGWSPQTDRDALRFLAQMEAAELFPRGRWMQIAIAALDDDRLLGDVGVCVAVDGSSAEVGFTLAAAAQGKGIATDALGSVFDLLFERPMIGRIVAITDARNGASIRLLERLRMRRVASVDAIFREAPCVEHHYERLRSGS
jgi:RimJ/RimL family protein N-acetyltransferase